jgi:hypothetical protein
LALTLKWAARGALEKQRKEKQLVGQRCVKRQRGWKVGDQAGTADEEAGVVVGETCRTFQKNGKKIDWEKVEFTKLLAKAYW